MSRLAIKSIAITLGMLLLIAGAILWWLRTSLPDSDRRLRLAGLGAPVEVIRDAHAVPHIFAASDNDAFFAMGFVHAQDRLWQMEMNRHLAAGRLAEIVGEDGLATDVFFRTLGLYRAAGQAYEALDAATRAAFNAYAAGVNAFFANREGALAPEFYLLRHQPEAWTPVDSLAWLKMMAWDLGGNWRDEAARIALLARLTPQQAAQFLPAYPGEPNHPPLDLESLYPGVTFFPAPLEAGPVQARLQGDGIERGLGSNNWVIGGARTTSGKPLLANDPHLGLNTPSIWYLAHLSIAGRNVVGATLPALPFVVLGRNDRMAWGFTNTGPDVQDLFIERLADERGLHYLTETGPREFLIREERIGVRDRPSVVVSVRETRHGPVISDALPDLKRLIDARHVIAFRWTALDENDTTAAAGWRIGDGHDWPSLLAAVRPYYVPQQNIVYADVDGNIGYVAPGHVPIRNPESATMGLVPARGWLGKDEWIGAVPFEGLPQRYNPPAAMMATANEKIVGPDYPFHLTDDWAPPYRGNRIRRLLAARAKHDIASFAAMQFDPTSDMVVALRDLMLEGGAFNGRHQEVRAALAAWDGAMRRDRPEPLIQMAWHRALARLVYGDELGDLFTRFWQPRPLFLTRVLKREDGHDRWCDRVDTAAIEDCDIILAQALDEAMAELSQRYGKNWHAWRWGDAHKLVQAHRPLSQARGMRRFFEIVLEIDGGPEAINVSPPRFAAEEPFYASAGPSYRAIYDLADLDASRYVIPTGQSGNPFSRHYRDLAPLWRDGQYFTIATGRAALKTGATGVMTLSPPETR
ncbi:MAG: penicillin acylase family protein [Pseudomonadota bacterium]